MSRARKPPCQVWVAVWHNDRMPKWTGIYETILGLLFIYICISEISQNKIWQERWVMSRQSSPGHVSTPPHCSQAWNRMARSPVMDARVSMTAQRTLKLKAYTNWVGPRLSRDHHSLITPSQNRFKRDPKSMNGFIFLCNSNYFFRNISGHQYLLFKLRLYFACLSL